jgi:hypothetical protein
MKRTRLMSVLFSVVMACLGLGTATGQIADGLLNYWNFEGNFNDTAGLALGSTSTVNDNGTPANAAAVTLQPAGPLGQFGKFNRSYIAVPNSDDILAAGEDLTISAWFRVTAFNTDWQALIAHGEGSDYRIARRGADSVMAYAGGSGDIPGGAQGPLANDGEWHHIVAISENGVSTRLWVDGALVAEGAAPTITNNGSTNLHIGGNPNAGGREWNGDIDDVAMWGRPLTEEEIAEIFSKGQAGQALSSMLTPNPVPSVGPATLVGQTIAVTFTDTATNQVDVSKARSMTVDGAVVNPTTITKDGAVTTLSFTSPTPYPPGSLHTVDVSVTTTSNTVVTASRTARAAFVSNQVGGGAFDTEHVWTQGAPQLSDILVAEEALNDPSLLPVENVIVAKTAYIHFHDDVPPPYYGAESKPFPLWDPANGGTGFGTRDDFAIRSRGKIFIKEAGLCWFICNSDDGFSLRIDGVEIGTAGLRGRSDTVMSVDLTAGAHDVEFLFFERGGGAGVSVFIHKGVSAEAPPAGPESYELLQAWLNPADSDGDGMLDSYETANGLNPSVNDAALDKDADGLTNLQESQRGTRADKADTDDDGVNDKAETGTGIWVNAADTGTNPLLRDTDGDTLADGAETNTGTFVNAANAGTNPHLADTDGDGVKDGIEIINGTNPTVKEDGFDFSLVAYWPMDADYNSAVNGHTATANGAESIPFAAAKFGNGIKLNGDDQFLVVDGDENVFDFAQGQDMTVSAWFTADAIDTDWQCLMGKGEGNGWRMHRRGGDQPPELSFAGGAGDLPRHNTALAIGDGTIHHVLAISQALVGTKLYLDGVLVVEGGAPAMENRSNPMQIGANPDTAPGRYWEGIIDDVALWSRALSDAEVQQIWNGGQGRSIQQLLGPITPTVRLEFTDVQYNKLTDQFTLSWSSTPGQTYTLGYSSDLKAFGSSVSTTIPSGGATTTFGPFANPTPGQPQIFFKAKQN